MEEHKVNIIMIHNDDNVMHASVWFVFFGELFSCQKPLDIWEGDVTTRRNILKN